MIPNRHQRRAMLAADLSSSPVFRDRDLTDLAFDKLTERMAHYGNVLTATHREALYCVVGRFTHLANGYKPGRWGYALPCGAGKTEAAKAWCWALWKLGKPYSVAISAAKVEALCDLKRGLLELGVPEEAIGLIHSYPYRPEFREKGQEQESGTASLPCTGDNHHRQIVLLTHNKIRGRFNEQMPPYRNKPRSLLIYDESLLISDAWHLTKTEINQALGHLGPLMEDRKNLSPDLHAAYAYCVMARDTIVAELEAQKQAPHRSPVEIRLDSLTSEDQDRYCKALYSDLWTDLRRLVKFAQNPMRALVSGEGGGTIWYNLAIPNDLQAVCVLDASLVIRHLPKLGGGIKEDPAFIALGNVKGHGAVQVQQMYWHSGRHSMTKQFAEKRENRMVSKEVIEVVRTIPLDQGVIIWSFKHRGGKKEPDILEVIRGDLKAAGIDVEATVPTTEGPKPRFALLTWGNETSSNDYAYCQNVIMAGVLHRGTFDLAAAIVGQKDDLLADVSEVATIKRSEIAHCVYQALSRGSCRKSVEGEAMPMQAWIIHPDAALEQDIKVAMQEVQWGEWTPRFLKGIGGQKTRKAATAILDYLTSLAPEVIKVSGKSLKAAVAMDATEAVWRDAVAFVEEVIVEWCRAGRSFVRTGAKLTDPSL